MNNKNVVYMKVKRFSVEFVIGLTLQ